MTKPHSDNHLKDSLQRLARFGANISDAHSCFIFLPTRYPEVSDSEDLELGGYHSLSTLVIEDCQIARGSGLVGWVAKHHRSIHVSPFERDSRTLGTYSQDQQLKSFIGIPVELCDPTSDEKKLTGVIACDSKKSFAFSKLQGKLLEELALEVSDVIDLTLRSFSSPEQQLSWKGFLRKGELLIDALGQTSVDAMRLKLLNFEHIETQVGPARCIELVDQIFRLIQQALPPHFPVYRMPNGDILLLLDNMMTSFFQTRIEALCQHVNPAIQFDYVVRSSGDRRTNVPARTGAGLANPVVRLEDLVAETGTSLPGQEKKGSMYGYKRA